MFGLAKGLAGAFGQNKKPQGGGFRQNVMNRMRGGIGPSAPPPQMAPPPPQMGMQPPVSDDGGPPMMPQLPPMNDGGGMRPDVMPPQTMGGMNPRQGMLQRMLAMRRGGGQQMM